MVVATMPMVCTNADCNLLKNNHLQREQPSCCMQALQAAVASVADHARMQERAASWVQLDRYNKALLQRIRVMFMAAQRQ